MVPFSPGGGDGASGEPSTGEGSESFLPTTTSPTSSGSSNESTTSGRTGGPDCEPLPAVPPGAEFTWCTADPYALPPLPSKYVSCVDGFVEFRQTWATGGTFLFYDVTAQFYSVLEDNSLPLYGSPLDPYDGSIDDCALYQHDDNGSLADMVFEDPGAVTFAFGDIELAGERNAGASLISFSANAAEQDISPQFLAPHGFTVEGDGGPLIDLPTAVALPDPIVLAEPPTDGTAVIDRDAFTLVWEPSALDIPLDLVLGAGEDDDRITLFCRMNDDGEFTVPAALACHLPATEHATLILTRADRRLLTTEDGHNIVVVAETSSRPSVTLP